MLFVGVQPFILILRSLTPSPSPKERGVISLCGEVGAFRVITPLPFGEGSGVRLFMHELAVMAQSIDEMKVNIA